MSGKKITLALVICVILAGMVLLSGCAEPNREEGTAGSDGVAGFWAGLWQGLILPVAFVISLFDEGVGIYEIHNNGNWYNLGFVIGSWCIFSCLLASKKKKKG